MLHQEGNRFLLVLATTAMLALAVPPPATAAGSPVGRSGGEALIERLFARLLVRLGLVVAPAASLKCADDGASIDPNGCPKQTSDESSRADRRFQLHTQWRADRHHEAL